MILLRCLWLAVTLLFAVVPAYAQKTKAALITEIGTNWPDNTSGGITPALLRSTVIDIVNSYIDANGGSSLPCAAHQWMAGIATLSSVTCTQPVIVDISGWGSGVPALLGATVTGSGSPVGSISPTISGLTLNGSTTALTISPTANTLTQGLVGVQSGPTSGTTAGPWSWNLLTVTDGQNFFSGSGRDAFDLLTGDASAFRVNYTMGTSDNSPRLAGTFAINYTGTGSASQPVGLIGSVYSNTSPDSLWGHIGFASLGPAGTARFMSGVIAEVSAQTGSAIGIRSAFTAYSEAPVQGSTLDAVLTVAALNVGRGTPGGFKNVIAISNNLGAATALDTAANFFSADTATTIANFAQMGNVTVSGNIFAFPNLTINGTGGAFFGGSTAPQSSGVQIKSSLGTALVVGTGTGLTNQTFTVDASVGSGNGVYVFSNNAGSGATIATVSTATNEGLFISSKGSGNIILGQTSLGALSTGNVGLFNASPKARLDVNANTASSPALVQSTSLQRWQSVDGSNGGTEWVSYGNGAGPGFGNLLTGAVAGGTSAAITATPTGYNMFNLRGNAWTGSAWALGGIITIASSELWSSGHQGTAVSFFTTPNATTSLTNSMTLENSGGLNLGATIATLAASEFGLNKISASGSAPGAGTVKLAAVAGTTGGTCKLIMYAGTSTTPTTIIDNVGAGC